MAKMKKPVDKSVVASSTRADSPAPALRGRLLYEEVIGVVAPRGGRAVLTLPAVFERLGASEALEFTALQRHQIHPWFAFLVQVAAIAAHADTDASLNVDAARWRARLLALTSGAEEPWTLVVPALDKAALLQPPVPEGSLQGWSEVDCADSLDLLVTAKNHDVKANRIAHPRLEHWLYTLVSLQTMQGYSGRDNHGISRMNGGFGSRPALAYAKNDEFGTRFVRDVAVLLESREDLVRDREYRSTGGLALVWLEPWDGSTSLGLSKLDPFYVELCRRVRLVETSAPGARVTARTRPTKKPRIEAKEQLGNVGDPWVPIEQKSGKALTVAASGFSYKRLRDLIFRDGWLPSCAFELRQEDGKAPVVVARALVRGQGKTEGLHERLLPVPAKARGLLSTSDGQAELAARSTEQIKVADDVRRSVLRPALLALLQGGAEKLNLEDKRADPFTQRLDGNVDRIFFAQLFDGADQERGPALQAWQRAVLEAASEILESAMHTYPIPIAVRWRAVAAADRAFRGGARKYCPSAFEELETTRASAEQAAATRGTVSGPLDEGERA